jgi:Ran GTPase-activating protein (RanGAP) involved in mRNA processing and transport
LSKTSRQRQKHSHSRSMLIQGSSTDAEILASFWNAKNDEECTELDLREVNFDYGKAGALVDLIRGKPWQSVKLSMCIGLVNDVLMACMSQQVTRFHLQSGVNHETLFALSFGLKYSKPLLHLSLSVDISRESANWLTKAIARNTWLETLDLSSSSIDGPAVGSLGFALRLNRTLKKLIFDGCYLKDDQVSSLLMALQDHPELRVLSLQQNSCHTQGMSAIASLLHYNDLERLDLSYLIRKKKTEATPELQEERKQEQLKQGEKEDKPDDKKDETGDGDEKDDEGSKEDDTSDNEQDDENKEQETPDGEEQEDPNKVKNTSLKVLHLAGNGLGDVFIQSILGIFGKHSALEDLNLFGNRITDFGLNLIIDKLPQLEHLKCLWVGHNSFSIAAGKDLVDVMRTNYTLEDVNLRSMDDGTEALQKNIEFYARLNRGGRRIHGSKNKVQTPLSLWPLVLERANRVHWGGATNNTLRNTHAADTIFCLIQGPVLFENPNILL